MIKVLPLFTLVLMTTIYAKPDDSWGGNTDGYDLQSGGRVGRQAYGSGGGFGGQAGQGFGSQRLGGQGSFGAQGSQGSFGNTAGYGIKNWYNTPEGWGYDATYPGGETHFHSKRGRSGAGGLGGGQGGSGFGGGNGPY